MRRTRFSTLRIILGTCLAASLQFGPAHAETAGQPDRLRIGTMNNFAPFNYVDPETRNLTGFNVDLAKAIGEEMGLPVEFVIASFPDLIPGLETARFDLIVAGLTDNATRRESMAFVDYMEGGPSLFTLAGKAAATGDAGWFCGRTVAHVRMVAVFGEILSQMSENECVAKGKPPITIFTDDLPVQLGLAQDRYDAALVARELVLHLQKTEPGIYVQIGKVLRPQRFGIAFRKDETVYRDAVGAAVQALIDNGTYATLLAKYGLGPMAIDKVRYNEGYQ